MDEVLPDIRKHGAYVTENVDEDYLKYTYVRLKNTFTSCPIEFLLETYEDCMEWHKQNKTRIPYANNSKKRSDATHTAIESRIMIMQKIISTLESRNVLLCEAGKFGIISEVDNVIKQIKDNVKKQYNKSNGAKIANKTKKINQLQKEIDYHNPKLEEFLEIPVHAYSSNYMFESYIYNGKISTKKSDGYKKWIDNFPDDLIRDAFNDVDLNKPTKLWLKFDALEKFDRDNLVKATQDQIVRALGFKDDNNIELGLVQVNKKVNKYSDGKIYILLKNIN
jgi:Holliday junction resolvase RusA-like endonuclease